MVLEERRMTSEIAERLDKSGLHWTAGAPLKNYCHWQIGGPADYLVEPSSADEIALARAIARETGLPSLVIGHGSNMLFDDQGDRGLIIKIGSRFSAVRFDGGNVYAEAGLWTPSLARACAARGLTGLEHAVGIPGNFGGLLFMNGGSMRQNIGDTVKFVDVLDENGQMRRITGDE